MARLALLLALAVLCWAPATVAQAPQHSACGDEVDQWVARCSRRLRVALDSVECPTPGLLVLGSTAVRVEVVHDPGRGFRRVNGWGISPVGADREWARIPAAERAAFEEIVACVAADGALPTAVTGSARSPLPAPSSLRASQGGGPVRVGTPGGGPMTRETAPVRVPWRALLACALLVAAWWPRRTLRAWRVRAAVVAVAVAAIVGLRWVVFMPAFFHQNGQGPLWIDMTRSNRLPYGTGFAELFSGLVTLFPSRPEAALFLVQSTLAALALCAGWSLARRSATSPEGALPTAAALFAGMVVSPTLGRLAGSESYFATCLSLEFIAAWALTLGGVSRGSAATRLRSLAPTIAAGLLLSLAVAVHPICWVPSAMVPLVMLVGPGSLRRRALRTAIAYGTVGVVVAATALPGVVRVLQGELGRQWMPRSASSSSFDTDHVLKALLPWLASLVVLLAATRRPVRALPRIAVGLLVLVSTPLTDHAFRDATPPWITSAFTWLHAPVLVAVLASLLSDVPRTRRQAWALAALIALSGLGFAARHHASLTAMPTDAMELRTLVAWRDRLPARSTVMSLWRAGDHLLAFPLYPSFDPLGRRLLTLDERHPAHDVVGGGSVYYYRSSVCTTAQGRPLCDAIERRFSLEPVRSATFPARWSLRHLDYDRPRVSVGLYRVRGVSR